MNRFQTKPCVQFQLAPHINLRRCIKELNDDLSLYNWATEQSVTRDRDLVLAHSLHRTGTTNFRRASDGSLRLPRKIVSVVGPASFLFYFYNVHRAPRRFTW